MRNCSQRYSDEFHYQDCDYRRRRRWSMKRKSSSSSGDYPTERTRYYSQNMYDSSQSVKRRRYDSPSRRYPCSRSVDRRRYDVPSRYPCSRSVERSRYYSPNHHACALLMDRRRYDDPNRHPTSQSMERRKYEASNRYPSSRHTERREYVCLNHPSEGRRGPVSVSKTREEIIRDVSSNFLFGSSRKRSTECFSSNCLDVSGSLAGTQDGTLVGSFPCFVSDGIVTEILSRLPVKSLMRFKSVCKHWLSLIKHDRRFIELHYNNSLKSSPSLICISGINSLELSVLARLQKQNQVQEHDDQDDEQQEYGSLRGCKCPLQVLCADIVEGSGIGEEIVPQAITNKVIITDDKWFDYEHLLGLVNGLACFLGWDEDGVRLYNVSTREATPWIKSTLLSEEKDKFKDISFHREVIYRFGFDPEKKEHKVFRFSRLPDSTKPCLISECPDYTSCEVLTVGRDTKWRRINVVPNENNQIKINKVFPSLDGNRAAVYANGTIYWRNKVRSCSNLDAEFGNFDSNDPDVIVAFDVGSEKFRVIPIPNFILDEPHVHRAHAPPFLLRGRIAVVYWLSDNIVKLWMLDDGADKKLENCQGSERNWISETITLPNARYSTTLVEFHGFADQLVLFIYSEDDSFGRKFSFLQFYDSMRKTFNKIEVDELSSVPFSEDTSLVTTFTGSLYPVQPQQDHQMDNESSHA